MNITFFDINTKKKENFFRKELKGHTLKFFKESLHKVPIKEFKNSDIIIVFIHSEVSKKILSELPKLKVVLTQSTGFDHIDLNYCSKKKIQVGTVPAYGDNTVAEHAFALMLNLSRNVHKSYLRTKKGNFSINGLQGFDLKGKTLGILGVGKIGLHVIKIAKGFGMHVKAYDINQNHFLSELLHFNYCDLDEILKTSDIISLHMPLLPSTKHFLDDKKLKKTKRGVIIINTARGELINTIDLYNHLKKGHIGGAGLDVIEGEEMIAHEEELLGKPDLHQEIVEIVRDKKIFEMENVIFTPHNAFNSREAVLRISQTTLENIISYIKSKEVKHKVHL